MKLRRTAVAAVAVLAAPATGSADPAGDLRPGEARGLQHPVRVVRDGVGVPHVFARSDHDVFFANGYLHAQDRFFQMDRSRKVPDGRDAELMGAGDGDETLGFDAFLRTLGLRRAAERSAAAYPSWVMADLQAYADGVNLWLRRNPLPPEYAALELTKASVEPWTPVDSILTFKWLTTQLGFFEAFNGELPGTARLLSYLEAGHAGGFDGPALLLEDVARAEPFEHTVSIPPGPAVCAASVSRWGGPEPDRRQVALAAGLVRRTGALGLGTGQTGGSNWWLVAGAKSTTGFPLLAGDPHLPLPSPAVWHEIQLNVRHGSRDPGLNVYGTNIPGVPGVVHGFNNHLMWTSTTNPLDVADFFQERVLVENGVPVATLHQGVAEPLITIQETFRANQLNGVPDDIEPVAAGQRPSGLEIPAATLVVPRLNNGPLLTAPEGPAGEETAIGVAFTGFSATRELEAILGFDRARTLTHFKRAVQHWDVGSQNWAVADVRGNIAYWTSGEAPLREDLESGAVAGLPPFLLRDGTGAEPNGWIPDAAPDRDQALPYEVLPFDEMPQVVNPRRGFIANANNDPNGATLDNDPLNQLRPNGGIRYLLGHYDSSIRVARVTRLLEQKLVGGRRVSLADMARIQGDVALLDAQVLSPYIREAYHNAAKPEAPPQLAALAADPAVTEAVRRLSAWDTTTPTGIAEGYDARDVAGTRGTPGAEEVAHSVAATLYTLWRSRILDNTIIATLERVGLGEQPPADDQQLLALRRFLDTFATAHGVGASGLRFFDAPGVDLAPEAERDLLILTSLAEALDLAASPAFAAAFGGSTDQDDYRWGRLHRTTLAHPLGNPFSVPSGGGFTSLAPNLPGLSTDGGYETIDVGAADSLHAEAANAFTYTYGASRRFIGEATPHGIHGTHVIAGGESGDPASPWFANQVGSWLTNEAHPVRAPTHPDRIRPASQR